MRQTTLAAIVLLVISALVQSAAAQSCFQSTIVSPTPFMGNHDEVFRLADGSFWKVQYEYEYLYEYYPTVSVCPSAGRLIVGDHSLNVIPLSPTPGSNPVAPRGSVGNITVVAARSGCNDYFVADGPQGYYLLEWYGGHSPSVGDVIVGNLGGYGMKDIFYPQQNAQGRVWVDDFLLSKSSAVEKYAEKCR